MHSKSTVTPLQILTNSILIDNIHKKPCHISGILSGISRFFLEQKMAHVYYPKYVAIVLRFTKKQKIKRS